jgi:hypothetical protein
MTIETVHVRTLATSPQVLIAPSSLTLQNQAFYYETEFYLSVRDICVVLVGYWMELRPEELTVRLTSLRASHQLKLSFPQMSNKATTLDHVFPPLVSQSCLSCSVLL